MIILGACQTATPEPTATPIPTATATAIPATPVLTLAETQPDIYEAWESGAHSAAYDLGKGPNTYCARCHSPENWDSQATIDPPPNCVSCKFQTEATPRIAIGNPLISEADWKGINCEACHLIENETVVSDLTWYDTETGYHETLENSTKLCEKCHTDTETLKYKIDMGTENHVGFVCTNCHDPHNLTASCTQSGCHDTWGKTTPSAMPGHPSMGMGTSVSCAQEGCHSGTNFTDKPTQSATNTVSWNHQDGLHTAVTCIACHDASDLQVKFLEEEKIWVVIRITELLGRTSEEVYQSHAITRNVNCARCHYVGNPWELPESVGWTSEQ